MKCPSSAPLHIIHAHSVNSVLDAAATVDHYIDYAKDNDLNFVSLTEHGYAIGWHELVTKCKKAGVKSCCACEIYLMPRDDTVCVEGQKAIRFYHLTLLAKNEIGFKNLRTLCSRAWGPGRVVKSFGNSKPRVTFEDLALYSEGIICGSGCIEGPVAKHIIRGEKEEAYKNAAFLKEVFKDDLFVEIMPTVVDKNFAEETIEVENEQGVKYVFGLTDTVDTPDGRMTIKEAMEKNIKEIYDPMPKRAGNPETTDE